MIKRRNRITVRLTDDQLARFKMCFTGYKGGRSIWNITDLVVAALEDFWKSAGAPCPTPPAVSDKSTAAVGNDLFSSGGFSSKAIQRSATPVSSARSKRKRKERPRSRPKGKPTIRPSTRPASSSPAANGK
jgi:hypothetical protein